MSHSPACVLPLRVYPPTLHWHRPPWNWASWLPKLHCRRPGPPAQWHLETTAMQHMYVRQWCSCVWWGPVWAAAQLREADHPWGRVLPRVRHSGQCWWTCGYHGLQGDYLVDVCNSFVFGYQTELCCFFFFFYLFVFRVRRESQVTSLM